MLDQDRDAAADDRAVDRFAAEMKAKMARARAKGRRGWDDPALCPEAFLADLFVGHLAKTNGGNFLDLAIIAMMLHARGAAADALPAALARGGFLPDMPLPGAVAERAARLALEAAAAEIDCGCGGREAALAATDRVGRWQACGRDPCGALEARAIRAIDAAGIASRALDEAPAPPRTPDLTGQL